MLGFRGSIKKSIEHLDAHNSILIFPEDSSEGYKDEIESFHAGFVFLAKTYYNEKKKHIPIIPLYYHRKAQEIRTGKAYTLDDFKEIKSRNEIAEKFRLILNELTA